MKKIIATSVAIILSFALSGCAQFYQVFGLPNPLSTPEMLIAETWSQTPELRASDVVGYLRKVNYCLPEAADFLAPDPATEYGAAWAEDQVRSCQDWHTVDDAPGGCQLTYYVSVGSDELFDPKRSLIYEDSMSVALLYGPNWQLELSPARGAADPIETTKANCADYTQKLIDTIGGQVTRLGQYD